jgi:integral membrane sensor domain MASE1
MSSFSLTFDNVLLVIHVAAVLVAFGVLLGYPIFVLVGNSIMEPRGLPLFHRAQQQLIRRLVTPGLATVVVTGLVLAEDLGTLQTFYVELGILAAIALGAITSCYLSPRELRLAEMAERDLRSDAAVLSREYEALSGQVAKVTRLASGIVLATILVMIAHT